MKTKKRLLSILLSLVMVLGLMPGMGLTVYAETQVNQVDYVYNGGMTLNTISAEFYDDNSVKSITATYSWNWGDVAGQSLVLVDKMIPKEDGEDYSVTYPYYDGDSSNRVQSNIVDTFEKSKGRVSNVVPYIQFVANSEMQEAHDGGNNRVLQFSKEQLPSDGNNTYYLFLWTDRGSNDPGVYPDYHLVTVIVSGGELYIGQGESVPAVPTYTVTLTGGDNATPSGGNTTQSDLKGKMTDVVYTANDGYYFPENYAVTAVNGISVTRDSYTQITVSGTPTANAAITLTAPTAKTGQEAPTGLSATKASSSTATDGKISGVTSAMEYQIDGASTWIAVGENKTEITGLTAGTYKVRYAGTANKNASPATTVEVGVKGAATVTKAPTAKSLIYTGSAQELVTASEATGGEMQYALGTKDAATEEYTTSIPTATDAGTYYVWYKAVGDATHTDSDPACVTVTISAAPKEPDTPVPPAPTVERADIMLNSSFLVSWKDSNVEVVWGTVPTADSYEVWATYCGTETFQNIQAIQGGNTAVISAFDGKPLDKKRCVKAYVIAKSGGVEIGRTLIGHAAGPKNRHTNVKKLKVKKRTYNLKVGKSAKIKATTKKMKGGKSLLPKNHDPRLRYLSTNTNVATVSGKGKITAVGAGTCDVWVYAQNGRSQKVTVVVQ